MSRARHTSLVYELLDAHDDTARLAADLAVDPRWRVHLEYLRDLQRVARETLAQTHGAEKRHRVSGRAPRHGD
jgi:hypothetical protein